MEQTSAFEQQLARVTGQVAGPVRSIDATAVVQAAKAAPEGRWSVLGRWFGGGGTAPTETGFSMFSAVKFVAAGVIVALFGGFLLAGVLTTPQADEVLPAAVSASPTAEAEPAEATQSPNPQPSPTTTGELLSDMVTEEVEPGVLRVLNDGVRDLASANNRNLVIGNDAGVWLARKNRLLRLGSERTHRWPDDQFIGPGELYSSRIVVATDGTVWTTGASRLKPALHSFDGRRWTMHAGLPTGGDIVVAGDGAVWMHGYGALARLSPQGWRSFDASEWPSTARTHLSALDDGVPVLVSHAEGGDESGHEVSVWRFDDGAWQEWRTAELDDTRWWDQGAPSGSGARVGSDGTVWALGYPKDQWGSKPSTPMTYVARLDDSGLREWGPADGVPNQLFWPQVSSDGSLWGLWSDIYDIGDMGPPNNGVAHFDGETWSHYLPGHHVGSLDFADDGSVWLLAGPSQGNYDYDPDPFDDLPGLDPLDLYVITPEAAAAKGAAASEPPPVEAPTDAESPATADLLPGVDLVTEEVEPGVYRVINDGVRDFEYAFPEEVVAGSAGSVWLAPPNRLVRVGGDVWHEVPGSHEYRLAVAPDGTTWVHDRWAAEGTKGLATRIRSFDGKSWIERKSAESGQQSGSLTVAPDGTVWAAWQDPRDRERLVVARHGPAGWEPLGGSIPGDADLGMYITESGDVWVADDWGADGVRLHRNVDGVWQQVPLEAEFGDGNIYPAAHVGSDGTVWLVGSKPSAVDGELEAALMRFDGTVWESWDRADGLPPVLPVVNLRQAQDGALWMASWHHAYGTEDQPGVARFDGSGWQRFLPEHAVVSLDVAADGSAWVIAGAGDDVGLYVITPEAVAATE